MDRTNWQWGTSNLNFLVLSACYRGVAIPLYWIALDKKGNSDTAERIALINRFISGFGTARTLGLLADREFVGNAWFAYLVENNISFVIRIKKNHKVINRKGISIKAERLFSNLKPDTKKALSQKQTVMGQSLYLAALKLADDQLVIVATDQSLENAIDTYAHRWEIETLFSCLKGRGFNFEETRLTHLARIESLFGVLAMAFAWAHKIGDWRHEQKPITTKKHGRLAMSYFRYGLDWISQALLDTNGRMNQLHDAMGIFIKNFQDIKFNTTPQVV